jgi:putative transcriptional regulator
MAKRKTTRGDTIGTASADTKFGRELIAGLKEALAHKRGEIALPTRVIEDMPAVRVKEIRKKVAVSTKDFEAKFGVPARTVEGWEQGKKLDVTGRILLRMIESKPKALERIAAGVIGTNAIVTIPMAKAKLGAAQKAKANRPTRVVGLSLKRGGGRIKSPGRHGKPSSARA